MLLHEKMRLQRKVNKLTYKQLRASSRKERFTKQIERVQKCYSKKEAALEAHAKRLQNNASLFFKNTFGLASNMISADPRSYLGGGLANGGVLQTLQQGLASGAISLTAKDNDGTDLFTLTQDELYNLLSGNGYKQVNKNGVTYIAPADADTSVENWEPDEELQKKYKYAQSLQSMASMQYQQNQSLCTNAMSNYESNISIWLEYEKERLEAEQDEVLLPLQEQETEWDMESQSAETQLADARARLDSIKQALSEGIKDSAPTFGLG